MPGSTFYFQNADIVSQVLNFGLSAPIDVQIQGADINKSYDTARQLLAAIKKIPGVADAHIQQVMSYPGLKINVDRQRAIQVGLSQRDVANNMLTGLSSSSGVSPSFFLSPVNGVNYFVAVQMPLPQVSTVSQLMNMPMAAPWRRPIRFPRRPARPACACPTSPGCGRSPTWNPSAITWCSG